MDKGATPQINPEDFHNATEHSYDPDEKGVCKDCGWWDPNGDICPFCGESTENHKCVPEGSETYIKLQVITGAPLFGKN